MWLVVIGGWEGPTFESELRLTFGSEVRQTPVMLLRSKLYLFSPYIYSGIDLNSIVGSY